MKTCRDVVFLVASDGLEQEPWWRRWTVALHLGFCTHCARLARQLRQIGGRSHQACNNVPPDLERNILRRLSQPDGKSQRD